MLSLFEFPSRYRTTGQPAKGSIDEISWISADRNGTDVAAVPRGAALYVRGWALDPTDSKPAAAVIITVDGKHTHEARSSLTRHDVAEAHANDAFLLAGFEALIPTGGLADGEHQVDISVADPDARTYASFAQPVSFAIHSSREALPSGLAYVDTGCEANVDEIRDEASDVQLNPSAGSLPVARGTTLYLRGWALDRRAEAPLGDLYAVVDGDRVYRAVYGAERRDVAEIRKNTALTNVGFEIRIPCAEISRGSHRLELVGLATGEEALLRSGILFDLLIVDFLRSHAVRSESTAVFLDEVVRVRGERPEDAIAPLRVRRGDRVFVRGWAFDDAKQTLAAGVILLLDEDVEVQALYGLPRPDVADKFGAPQLARCGFTAEIATDALAAGLHTVRCRVIASDGRGVLQSAQRFDFEVSELS
jgi:hypothetical protein